MVTAGKVFKLVEPMPLPEIASRLEGYRVEEAYEEGEYKFTLVSEVVRLTPCENAFTGVYSHDYITHAFHRGKIVPLPRTVEALFSFAQHGDRVLLTVVEKKRVANLIANRLSEIIFGKFGCIVEARIPPETLRDFHLKNPEDTKVAFFDNVDIPNINKLSLYGQALTETSLFETYLKHGDMWYILTKSEKHGYIVGVVRDGSVTIFSKVDAMGYLRYVIDEIFPLIV